MSHFPFLHNLAEREDLVRNGKLTSIIFLRDKNSKGQEVSGYIDYAHRLKSENFESYFERKKKLMPKPSDLSYYNWETQHSTSNSTPNFQVIADNEAGLLFKNKRDRKARPARDHSGGTARVATPLSSALRWVDLAATRNASR